MSLQVCLPYRVSAQSNSRCVVLLYCHVCYQYAHQTIKPLLQPRSFILHDYSKHQEVKAHFKALAMQEAENIQDRQRRRADASEWLASATGAKTLTTNVVYGQLQEQRKQGKIAKSTTDEELKKQAEKSGFRSASLHAVRNPLSGQARAQMESVVANMEHELGATHTNKYGDMRTHGGGAKKAKQRAANTNLTNASSLHHHLSAASK